jgi:hypothetical protein
MSDNLPKTALEIFIQLSNFVQELSQTYDPAPVTSFRLRSVVHNLYSELMFLCRLENVSLRQLAPQIAEQYELLIWHIHNKYKTSQREPVFRSH